MNVEQAVLQYVKPLTHQASTLQVQAIEPLPDDDYQYTLEQAGFKLHSATLEHEESYIRQEHDKTVKHQTDLQTLKQVGEQLNLNLILDRPAFGKVLLDAVTERKTIGKRAYLHEVAHYLEDAIAIKIQPKPSKLYERWSGSLPITKPEVFFMVEVKPEDYKGELPVFAVKATAQAVKAGLMPRVWIAGNQKELCEYVKTEITNIPIDPLVVGYASEPQANRKNQCLLIAAWGKDLEQINLALESQ